MHHFLDKISLSIGHVARAVTLLAFYLVTALVAVGTLHALITAPFEYSVSQDDLAMADVLSLVLIAVVCWRFFRRGQQNGLSAWSLVQRLCFTLTYTTLLCLASFAVLLFATQGEPESMESGMELVGGYNDLLTYGLTALFIAAIYGSTPLPPLFRREKLPEAHNSGHHQGPSHTPNQPPEPPTLKPEREQEPS